MYEGKEAVIDGIKSQHNWAENNTIRRIDSARQKNSADTAGTAEEVLSGAWMKAAQGKHEMVKRSTTTRGSKQKNETPQQHEKRLI